MKMVQIGNFIQKGSAEPRRAPNPGSAEGVGERFGRVFRQILGFGRVLDTREEMRKSIRKNLALNIMARNSFDMITNY